MPDGDPYQEAVEIVDVARGGRGEDGGAGGQVERRDPNCAVTGLCGLRRRATEKRCEALHAELLASPLAKRQGNRTKDDRQDGERWVEIDGGWVVWGRCRTAVCGTPSGVRGEGMVRCGRVCSRK